MRKAVIFNIMRYSVHDGPGIRTTVFFKGCPLACKWCHNPESIDPGPQQVFNAKKCIKCGRCSANPEGIGGNCPTGARETIGYEITVRELMKEISKDLLFHEQSSGGVTFSGGEPLYQAEFLLEVLAECRENYINTAVDTCGFCETELIVKAAEMADYFLYDLKFIDSVKHENYCGVRNDIILRNLKSIEGTRAKLILRVPVIPTINDDMEEMNNIFNFLSSIKNIEAIHLLPYHNIQMDKYNRIGKQYELSKIPAEESPNMAEIKKLFSSKYRTKLGG